MPTNTQEVKVTNPFELGFYFGLGLLCMSVIVGITTLIVSGFWTLVLIMLGAS